MCIVAAQVSGYSILLLFRVFIIAHKLKAICLFLVFSDIFSPAEYFLVDNNRVVEIFVRDRGGIGVGEFLHKFSVIPWRWREIFCEVFKVTFSFTINHIKMIK